MGGSSVLKTMFGWTPHLFPQHWIQGTAEPTNIAGSVISAGLTGDFSKKLPDRIVAVFLQLGLGHLQQYPSDVSPLASHSMG